MYTVNTMRNITLSAPDDLIDQARANAMAKGTTLNDEFRKWLETQASDHQQAHYRYQQLMERLSHVNAGRKFSREEMNER